MLASVTVVAAMDVVMVAAVGVSAAAMSQGARHEQRGQSNRESNDLHRMNLQMGRAK